eukprot:scaffold187945_cov18-Prasinocladus_malaysianus.AAC.1
MQWDAHEKSKAHRRSNPSGSSRADRTSGETPRATPAAANQSMDSNRIARSESAPAQTAAQSNSVDSGECPRAQHDCKL